VWRREREQQAAAAAASNDGSISVLDSFNLDAFRRRDAAAAAAAAAAAPGDDDDEESVALRLKVSAAKLLAAESANSPAANPASDGSNSGSCGSLVLVEGAAGSGKSCLLARMFADCTAAAAQSRSSSTFNGGGSGRAGRAPGGGFSFQSGPGRGGALPAAAAAATVCRVAHVVGSSPASQLPGAVPRRLAAALVETWPAHTSSSYVDSGGGGDGRVATFHVILQSKDQLMRASRSM
jgi:hypothetical protein